MFKTDHKKAQAATELAVFGAILIFIIGAIVRSAAGNSYTQNQNFKAMRMAMLESWNGSKAANIARNSASVMIMEDRLSPDLNKYGDLDRSPYIANSSGSFTYEMLYPLDTNEPAQDLPIMDMYINGQHFPFTTASYVANRTITRPAKCSYPAGSCSQNQCLRNQREWVQAYVHASQFEAVVPVSFDLTPAQRLTQEQSNAIAIFTTLSGLGYIENVTGNGINSQGTISSLFASTIPSSSFPQYSGAQIAAIQSILKGKKNRYKLFYTLIANGTDHFHLMPPPCSSHPCLDINHELSPDEVLPDINGVPHTNTSGDMQFDLLRNGDYDAVDAQFPSVSACSANVQESSMRCYVAWQWAATAAIISGISGNTDTSNGADPIIGLDPTNQQYPTYDIDGRLKEQTIYGITINPDGTPSVSYEDNQGGDIDGTWDSNSCGIKPGLQNQAQIYTQTKDGTYLQVKEGKLYNPETAVAVRSASKKNTIDLIQRIIQLSNNTHRFCSVNNQVLPCVGAQCINGTTNCAPSAMFCPNNPDPNPVEVCVDGNGGNTCFSDANFTQTCFNSSNNIIYVRSRLEDRRGHYWLTNASGNLQVQ